MHEYAGLKEACCNTGECKWCDTDSDYCAVLKRVTLSRGGLYLNSTCIKVRPHWVANDEDIVIPENFSTLIPCTLLYGINKPSEACRWFVPGALELEYPCEVRSTSILKSQLKVVEEQHKPDNCPYQTQRHDTRLSSARESQSGGYLSGWIYIVRMPILCNKTKTTCHSHAGENQSRIY